MVLGEGMGWVWDSGREVALAWIGELGFGRVMEVLLFVF